MKGRLAGKVAVITGGANGLGAEQVRLFAAEGARVVIADILSEQGENVAHACRQAGQDVGFIALDVTSEAGWASLVQQVIARHDRLDILVNNAGISGMSVQHLAHADAWDRLVAINAKGAYLGMNAVLPEMERQGSGAIVNLGSIIGLVGSPFGNPGYAASKAAVSAQSRAMAVRMAPKGIRVNAVHPGFFPEMLNMPAGARGDIAASIPMGRVGERAEIAAAVLFLASPEASYITGIDLVVDGGFTAQ